MSDAVTSFLRRVKAKGRRRAGTVRIMALGRQRVFRAYDLGEDTVIVEDAIRNFLSERPSVLIAQKGSLRRGSRGFVMTVASGNHSVSAFPLLDGRFWKLSSLPPKSRGAVLSEEIVCANVVGGRIELSQRDVPTARLVKVDSWLLEKGLFPLDAVVLIERNMQTLEHYRSLGQDWRVKPLAWTEKEMRVALAASRRRITSSITYYHSVRGIHFLSYADFRAFADLACTDLDAFIAALHELVGIFEGNSVSLMRLHRHRGHHEVELFGLQRGASAESVVPRLESLAEDIALGRASQLSIVQRINEICGLFEHLLSRPELADDTSRVFTEMMYMYITGEVYAVVGDVCTPAFDDRRTALPGATFAGDRILFHPGADARTKMLLENLKDLLSKDERVEYANVYELRGENEYAAIGKGSTREIAYKTNRRPLERALVEKALAHATRGYAGYMLSRVEGFKALGVALGTYRILRRPSGQSGRLVDFYIRSRCEGEPLDAIPAYHFCSADDSDSEDESVVVELAQLMGDAAAQNMAMKKFDPATGSPIFGVGKEIYEFAYDISRRRRMPRSVSICSIRGSLGWKDLSHTDANFAALCSFYLRHYAKALSVFAADHTVPMETLADRFLAGFAARTEAMEWRRAVMRDKFMEFRPGLPEMYGFDAKWRFAMWALERQKAELAQISGLFRSLLARKAK